MEVRESKMDEAHLPAVWEGWLPAWERWLLLSPNPGGTVAGASSPSSSVVPSMVAVPAPSCTRGHGRGTGLLVQGRPGTSGTLELPQDTPR